MKLLHMLGTFRLPQNPDDSASGIVRAALELAQAQTRRGHDVTLVSVGANGWETRWQGVTLRQLPAVPWARASFAGRSVDLSTHTPLIRLTQAETFDIVQGHLYYYLRFLRAGARIVHFHADPFFGASDAEALEAKRADFRVIAQTSDAQIAVSRFVAAQIRKGMELCGEIPNVHTVPNGVLHERFGSDAAVRAGRALRTKLGIPEGATTFLFVGAVVPEKGLSYLVGAFSRLAERDPRVRLLVAGSASLWDMSGQAAEGAYETQLIEQVRPLMHAGRVHLLGAVKSPDMPAVYAAGDVTVVPSVCADAFPLVALESLAARKPIIASNVGGLPETVGPHNGCLVAPGDEAALAAAMQVFTDPGLRAEKGGAAREASLHFSWDVAAATLDQIYETALSVKA